MPAHSGPIDVTAGETPILANAYVTFSAATLPNSTVIQIGETNCNGPLTVSSLPALAVLSTPATLPCVSGTVSATVTETLLTYGIATIVIAASDQTFTYFINVVLPA